MMNITPPPPRCIADDGFSENPSGSERERTRARAGRKTALFCCVCNCTHMHSEAPPQDSHHCTALQATLEPNTQKPPKLTPTPRAPHNSAHQHTQNERGAAGRNFLLPQTTPPMERDHHLTHSHWRAQARSRSPLTRGNSPCERAGRMPIASLQVWCVRGSACARARALVRAGTHTHTHNESLARE